MVYNTTIMNKRLIAYLIVTVGLAILFFVAPVSANAYSFRISSYRSPSYRTYTNGGSLYTQSGYFRNNGTYVQSHLKTRPDNTIYNNRKYILGY